MMQIVPGSERWYCRAEGCLCYAEGNVKGGYCDRHNADWMSHGVIKDKPLHAVGAKTFAAVLDPSPPGEARPVEDLIQRLRQIPCEGNVIQEAIDALAAARITLDDRFWRIKALTADLAATTEGRRQAEETIASMTEAHASHMEQAEARGRRQAEQQLDQARTEAIEQAAQIAETLPLPWRNHAPSPDAGFIAAAIRAGGATP